MEAADRLEEAGPGPVRFTSARTRIESDIDATQSSNGENPVTSLTISASSTSWRRFGSRRFVQTPRRPLEPRIDYYSLPRSSSLSSETNVMPAAAGSKPGGN